MGRRKTSGGSKRPKSAGRIKSSSGSVKRSSRKAPGRVTRTRISSPGRSKPPGRKPPASSPSSRGTSRPQRNEARKRLTKAARRPASRVPRPPRRQSLAKPAAVGAAVAAASVVDVRQQRQAEVDAVRRRFGAQEASAQLGSVFQAIGHFDSRLTALPIELDEMRERGYVHAGQLEDQIAALDEKWDEVRPRIESTLRQQVSQLESNLAQVRSMLARMNPSNANSISAADGAVTSLSHRIAAAEDAVSSLYRGLDEQIDDIDDAMDRLDWMLDQFESAGIDLRETEGPLAAAEAEWHQNGDEGPEGMLMLSDQRLLFEQREEIATRKVLGLITTESETIRKLLLEIEIGQIDEFSDLEERTGLLGLGRDEILEMVLSAKAPVSRARFHLLDQDSASWSALIQRVKSGAIDEDRAEDFLTEVDEADAMAAAFPSQCPQCFAPVPEVPRGVSSIVCAFCGTVIVSEAGEDGDASPA